jgi:hypothetical protein
LKIKNRQILKISLGLLLVGIALVIGATVLNGGSLDYLEGSDHWYNVVHFDD